MSDSPTGDSIKFGHGGARAGAGRKPKPAPPADPDIARWYCVHTGHDLDRLADIEIRRAGFVLFAPLVWKPATPARRDARGALRPGKPDRLVPLFPRYLFVRFRRASPEWVRILSLPGVDYLVGPTPETPRPVADEIIDLVRGLCAPNGCVYPDSAGLAGAPAEASTPPAPIEPGAPVTLLSGPFAGVAGICTWSARRRVRVLLEVMGRSVTVPMSRSAVEPA